MKSTIRRLYIPPVFGGPSFEGPSLKERLARTISSLKGDIRPFRYTPDPNFALPESTPEDTDRLLRAMSGMVFWPHHEELTELDAAVTGLAALERSKTITPRWKAYQLVNRRLSGFRLIQHLDALI